MYFIYGNEKFFIEQEINKIKRNNSDKTIEVFSFTNENIIDPLISLLNSQDLFNRKKLFLIYNLPFFDRKLSANDSAIVNQIIEAINVNQYDEFVFVNENIVDKNKIVKNELSNFLFNNSKFQTIMIEASEVSSNEINKTIKMIAKKHNVNIDEEAIRLLASKTSNDIMLLDQEIKKLSNETSQISANIVDISVDDLLTEDAFGFVNSFETNDLGIIWNKYKQKIIEGFDVSTLIGQISQILILAHQIYAYKVVGKSLDLLSKDLNINSYRIKKISFFLNKTGIKKIKKMINSLSSLDQDIKAGKINAEIGFERFLIKFFAYMYN
ncbi:DNA polymerase III subunit delta [Mycoplasmopsis primatum]|uniref:DNA polymerase III subunit delta n=1 Tax=Mycoplasmopsis primatum TaxID=55604 RepID=UPI000497C3F0|nr:DNA polymerase III subunit delta [Mycoplasmopsis primatum]